MTDLALITCFSFAIGGVAWVLAGWPGVAVAVVIVLALSVVA